MPLHVVHVSPCQRKGCRPPVFPAVSRSWCQLQCLWHSRCAQMSVSHAFPPEEARSACLCPLLLSSSLSHSGKWSGACKVTCRDFHPGRCNLIGASFNLCIGENMSFWVPDVLRQLVFKLFVLRRELWGYGYSSAQYLKKITVLFCISPKMPTLIKGNCCLLHFESVHSAICYHFSWQTNFLMLTERF